MNAEISLITVKIKIIWATENIAELLLVWKFEQSGYTIRLLIGLRYTYLLRYVLESLRF